MTYETEEAGRRGTAVPCGRQVAGTGGQLDPPRPRPAERGVSASGTWREIFRRAGERWLEGDRGALADYERGIDAALAEGELPAGLTAHQKLLAWAPGESDRHER